MMKGDSYRTQCGRRAEKTLTSPGLSHFSDLQIFQGQCRRHLGMVEEISHSHNLVERSWGWLRSEVRCWRPHRIPKDSWLGWPSPIARTPPSTRRPLPGKEWPALPITPSPGEGPEKPSGWRYIDAQPGTSGGGKKVAEVTLPQGAGEKKALHTSKTFTAASLRFSNCPPTTKSQRKSTLRAVGA